MVPNGKMGVYTDKVTGEKKFFRIKEKRIVHHWTWNGERWMTSEEFDIQYRRRKTGVLVSKNDFDAIGNRRR